MDDAVYIRMIPGNIPIIEVGQPRFSTIIRLLDMSNNGKLLVISYPNKPMISNTYTLLPGVHDDMAVFTQHMGGILP